MNKLLGDLESIISQMDRTASVMNCMFRSYFEEPMTNEAELKEHFEDCSNVIMSIMDYMEEERKQLKNTTEELYNAYFELKYVINPVESTSKKEGVTNG